MTFRLIYYFGACELPPENMVDMNFFVGINFLSENDYGVVITDCFFSDNLLLLNFVLADKVVGTCGRTASYSMIFWGEFLVSLSVSSRIWCDWINDNCAFCLSMTGVLAALGKTNSRGDLVKLNESFWEKNAALYRACGFIEVFFLKAVAKFLAYIYSYRLPLALFMIYPLNVAFGTDFLSECSKLLDS